MTDKQKAKAAKMRQQGYTLHAIATSLGEGSVGRVFQYLKAAGIKRGQLKHSQAFNAKPNRARDKKISAMRAKGATYREIAAAFNFSHQRACHIVNGIRT